MSRLPCWQRRGLSDGCAMKAELIPYDAVALGLEYEIHAEWIGSKWEVYTANSDINVIFYHSEFGTL